MEENGGQRLCFRLYILCMQDAETVNSFTTSTTFNWLGG